MGLRQAHTLSLGATAQCIYKVLSLYTAGLAPDRLMYTWSHWGQQPAVLGRVGPIYTFGACVDE